MALLLRLKKSTPDFSRFFNDEVRVGKERF